MCKLMESLLCEKGGPDLRQPLDKLHPIIGMTFVFCYLWGIGGNIIDSNWDAFDTYIRTQFEDNTDIKVNAPGIIEWA